MDCVKSCHVMGWTMDNFLALLLLSSWWCLLVVLSLELCRWKMLLGCDLNAVSFVFVKDDMLSILCVCVLSSALV